MMERPTAKVVCITRDLDGGRPPLVEVEVANETTSMTVALETTERCAKLLEVAIKALEKLG
jgi:hypothetical protein